MVPMPYADQSLMNPYVLDSGLIWRAGHMMTFKLRIKSKWESISRRGVVSMGNDTAGNVE